MTGPRARATGETSSRLALERHVSEQNRGRSGPQIPAPYDSQVDGPVPIGLWQCGQGRFIARNAARLAWHVTFFLLPPPSSRDRPAAEVRVGIEYSLRFGAPSAETVAAEFRALPGVREVTTPDQRFDPGGDPPPGWPDATVMVEPGGAYFCDHCGGGGRAMLGLVIARLTSAFGAVTVEEL